MGDLKPRENFVYTSLPAEIFKKFRDQSLEEKRPRPQLLRLIVEDYYSQKEIFISKKGAFKKEGKNSKNKGAKK